MKTDNKKSKELNWFSSFVVYMYVCIMEKENIPGIVISMVPNKE